MKPRVAINGFGRIGRLVFRRILESDDMEVVAINDLTSNEMMAHLLKYDSTFGTLKADVSTEGEELMIVDGKKVKNYSIPNPEELPWKEDSVDIVIEATGVFRTVEDCTKHLTAGAKKVILTAPGKDTKCTICMGVNEEDYNSDEFDIISNASCTTNCLAPLVKVINNNLTIKRGLITTIHSYTNDQNILDLPHKKDMRRARAAAENIIPTSTGAAKAIGLVIPAMEGKMDGLSIRVPTPDVSLVDLVCEVEKETSKEEINEMLRKEAAGKLKGILEVSDVPLVSMDFRGNDNSAILDSELTMVQDKTLVKILAWYDNEWGYSCRVVDMAKMVGDKM
ncbi:type I glyceraldehyde-3-phosphate dehydrogenase [Pseudomonadota bacterium]